MEHDEGIIILMMVLVTKEWKESELDEDVRKILEKIHFGSYKTENEMEVDPGKLV